MNGTVPPHKTTPSYSGAAIASSLTCPIVACIRLPLYCNALKLLMMMAHSYGRKTDFQKQFYFFDTPHENKMDQVLVYFKYFPDYLMQILFLQYSVI